MNKNIIQYPVLAFVLTFSGICSGQNTSVQSDEIIRPAEISQLLYNGKEWHNLYTMVKGDQFLFSKDYLPGSVTMNGKTYQNIDVNFDIYNDELITPSTHGIIIQLNKEMVDSFSLSFQLKTFRFINSRNDSVVGNGYVNVLYNQRSMLYIKYKKEIELLAVDDKYDLFFRTYKIFLLKDGVAHQLSGKKDLLNALEDNKIPVKDFIKKNKMRVSKSTPESFIPVIRYYDSLRK